MAKKDDKKLLEQARERFKRCVESDESNRKLAIEDLRFLHEPGADWDDKIKSERGNRPCFSFPKLRVSVNRVINDIRANRPQGKVRATEDGDKDTSSIMEGLVRNVWGRSDGDSAIDTAATYQVGGGMGAWRINTKYSTDDAWDQDIIVESIRNPFALWADPSARDPCKRDAEFWFLESSLSKSVYESKYGKIPSVEWEGSEFDEDDDWDDGEGKTRIAEYWYKKPVTKEVVLLDDGATVDAAEATPEALQGRQVMRRRTINTHQICMAIISGDKILEGPTEWAGAYFPFVQVYGEHLIIDGKVKWWGLTRHSKDAQRLHNTMLTNALETAANAPLAKWWATPQQAMGNTNDWARAHKENLPYLLFNPDPQNPGPPGQMNGSQIPAAFVNLAMFTSEEIKATTGIFDASLGNKSNETTGIAIRQRTEQGAIANFQFADNVAKGIRYTWEMLLDLIPKIYDTERTIRIIGSDGAEDYAKINTIDPQTGQALNDLSRGKYDTTITVGPSFATQRQESAEIYMGMAQAYPPLMQTAGDLIFKSMDLPYSADMAERMQAMLPPQIQQQIAQKKQSGGKQQSPEVMAAMAQANQAMEQVQQHGQMVQQAAEEAEGLKAEADSAVSQLKVEQAKLETQYQRIVADLAKKEAALTMKEAQFVATQTQAGVDSDNQKVEGDREALSAQVQTALAQMQQQAADFMTHAAQVIGQIQTAAQPQVVVANEPRNKMVRVKRVNGELIGTIEES